MDLNRAGTNSLASHVVLVLIQNCQQFVIMWTKDKEATYEVLDNTGLNEGNPYFYQATSLFRSEAEKKNFHFLEYYTCNVVGI